MQSIPEIVDDLFRTRRHSSGREHGYREIANDLQERYGIVIDPTVLRRVRIGLTTNPTAQTIRALALFFRVSPAIFFPDVVDIEEMSLDEQFVAALREAGMTSEDRTAILMLFRTRQKATDG